MIKPKPNIMVTPNKAAGIVIEIIREIRTGIVVVFVDSFERGLAVRVSVIGNVRVHQAKIHK
jgi:hypothetical protein